MSNVEFNEVISTTQADLLPEKDYTGNTTDDLFDNLEYEVMQEILPLFDAVTPAPLGIYNGKSFECKTMMFSSVGNMRRQMREYKEEDFALILYLVYHVMEDDKKMYFLRFGLIK